MPLFITALINLIVWLLRLPAAAGITLRLWQRLPKYCQPALPVMLGIVFSAADGFNSGLRGEELLTVALSGWQYGAFAIATWHSAKRLNWKKVAVTASLLPLLVACVNRDAIQKALVYEDQIQTQSAQLKHIADVFLPTLPSDVRVKVQGEFDVQYARLAVALDTKDKLLETALDSSSDSVNLVAVATDIAQILGAIVAVLDNAGVPAATLAAPKAQTEKLLLSASRL